MQHRWTIKQLEAMTTHEIAELLTNVVLLLRRLPNVPFNQLTAQATTATQREHTEVGGTVASIKRVADDDESRSL